MGAQTPGDWRRERERERETDRQTDRQTSLTLQRAPESLGIKTGCEVNPSCRFTFHHFLRVTLGDLFSR